MGTVKRRARNIKIEPGLNVSSLVAVKYSPNTVVLMYTDEWDRLSDSLYGFSKLSLSYISREFRVRHNSINLDKEFDEYLGKGFVDAQRYPRGIILQTHVHAVRAVA